MVDLSTPNPPQRQTKTKQQISQIFTAIRSRFAKGVVTANNFLEDIRTFSNDICFNLVTIQPIAAKLNITPAT
jgi:hypothetical protein